MIEKKTGQEPFIAHGKETDHKLLHYWQWVNSDILNNTNRGRLAEFIVAMSLGLTDQIRIEWDAWDLVTEDGIKIEVKSSAYIQSWEQKRHSTISFGIQKTKIWNYDTKRHEGESRRWADVYVFCLLAHKDPETIDPLNLDQWKFYVLNTDQINKELKDQQTVTFGSLIRLEPTECNYENLAGMIQKHAGTI